MKTGVCVWIKFQSKNCQSSFSFLDWAGNVDIEEASLAMDSMKAEDILKKKAFSHFSEVSSLSVIIREIATGKILCTKVFIISQ